MIWNCKVSDLAAAVILYAARLFPRSETAEGEAATQSPSAAPFCQLHTITAKVQHSILCKHGPTVHRAFSKWSQLWSPKVLSKKIRQFRKTFWIIQSPRLIDSICSHTSALNRHESELHGFLQVNGSNACSHRLVFKHQTNTRWGLRPMPSCRWKDQFRVETNRLIAPLDGCKSVTRAAIVTEMQKLKAPKDLVQPSARITFYDERSLLWK